MLFIDADFIASCSELQCRLLRCFLLDRTHTRATTTNKIDAGRGSDTKEMDSPQHDIDVPDRDEADAVDSGLRPAVTAGARPVSRGFIGRARSLDVPTLLHKFGIVLIWGVVIVVFGLTEPNTFLTAANFEAMFGTQSTLLMLALSLVITLGVGEFDLSVASILGLTATVIAVLNAQDHVPIVLSVLVGLAIGPLTGLINGFLVVRLDVDAIIVTLGMGTLLLGIALLISQSTAIGNVDPVLGTVTLTRIAGLPMAFFYSLIGVILIWYVQRFTPLGRYMLFVGHNREVAKLAGIRVERVRFGAYMVGGLVASIAGVMLLGISGGIEADSTSSLLLPAFAAAFLGAAAIQPGRFNAWGTLVAVYFLITGITGLELAGFTGWITSVFYGAALVIAVTVSRLLGRRA